jgi:membrane-bound lytic murein transglycosylase D
MRKLTLWTSLLLLLPWLSPRDASATDGKPTPAASAAPAASAPTGAVATVAAPTARSAIPDRSASKAPVTAQRVAPGRAVPSRGKTSKGKALKAKDFGIGKKATRSPGPAKPADPATRRAVAGVSAVDDADRRVETPEVIALREAEHELFGVAGRSAPSLVTEQPAALSLDPSRPDIYANGLPPPASVHTEREVETVQNTAWLSSLEMPDLPVHWNSRLIRYLDFYKNDARGRSIATI